MESAEANNSESVDNAVPDGVSRWDWKSHCATIERVSVSNFKFTCKYCFSGKVMTGGSTRMRDHLLGEGAKHVLPCVGVPSDVVQSLKAHVSNAMSQAAAKKAREREQVAAAKDARAESIKRLAESLSNGTASVNKKWRQSTVEECGGAAILDVTQQAVARMWYGCGLAFDLVTYVEVVDAFDAVAAYGAATGNNTFPMLSKPQLRNDRLDREVKRIESELLAHKASSAAYGLSLQSDGKDNVARCHLVNVVTTTPVGTEFREVLDVSGKSRDAEHTAQLLVDAVGRLSPVEQSGLVSIITDTPAVNKAAWKLLETKLPHVHCIPCAAH